MNREQIIAGYLTELESFEGLLRTLDDKAVSAPTRCEGWTVRDIAAHVVGTIADITQGRLEGQGQPETTARHLQERRSASAADLADELSGAIKGARDLLALFDDAAWDAPARESYTFSLRYGIETLSYDTFVHGDDIRAALGQPSVTPRASLDQSVRHLAEILEGQGWGPATLALDGVPEYAVGAGGKRVTGDAMQFVLAATGRADPKPLGLDETVNVYR